MLFMVMNSRGVSEEEGKGENEVFKTERMADRDDQR